MLTRRVMRCLLPTIPLALAIGAACAEPDPTYGEPGSIIGKTLPGGDGPSSSGGGDGGAGGAGGGGADPFGGAYSPTNPPPPTKTLKDAHANGGGPTPDTVGDCLTCHTTGGQAKGFIWAFGGRDGTKAAGIDVVVTDPSGNKIGPVKTDADGFFWAPGGPVVPKSKVAMRNANNTVKMSGSLQSASDGGCMQGGSCHGTRGAPGGDLK